MNILRALQTVLGLGDATWRTWCALIGGAFGCPLLPDMTDLFRLVTGREPLTAPCRELWLAIGRRGGKNRVTAAVVVFLALFMSWLGIAPGEVGTVLVLARDRVQARVAFRYILGLLQSTELLAQEIAAVTTDTITLRNGIEITIGTADNAAVRGRTIVAAICDEFAFWPYEQATEVLRALRPGMATQPDAMLIVISSVYAAAGPFYDARKRHYGVDDPHVLYAVATSQQMNPTLTDEFIGAELERDPVGNAAEYLSRERTDVSGFVDAPLVDSNTRSEPRELPRVATLPTGAAPHYFAAIDVSGGRSDAAACAVAHREGDRIITDGCWRFPAPHDPAHVAASIAEVLARYGLSHAVADQYGAELSRRLYAEAGLTLVSADVTRSEAYLRLLPLLTTGRIELPPDPVLRTELLGLERRVGRNGKDSVDHRPGAHDDVANAVALAAWAASRTATTGYGVAVVRSTILDGLDGHPVARDLGHPGDWRETDPLAVRIARDLF